MFPPGNHPVTHPGINPVLEVIIGRNKKRPGGPGRLRAINQEGEATS